jgi:hypothetical protein
MVQGIKPTKAICVPLKNPLPDSFFFYTLATTAEEKPAETWNPQLASRVK